ncbi:hypothetical protein [Streptomyces sp. NPDC001601]|uniref:hypothetical protein n=1 Tax=Streptomyces sp. NPDC001601 TaxID=3364592 RepID=UPI0036C9BDE7
MSKYDWLLHPGSLLAAAALMPETEDCSTRELADVAAALSRELFFAPELGAMGA